MKYFAKNLFRSAKRNLGTYIGAALIMALGVFIFVSMNDTFINLKGQVYSYYKENNMADIFANVISMPKERLKEFEDYLQVPYDRCLERTFQGYYDNNHR